MDPRIKIHMIGNAHLDPVWLWSWQAGVDEALATAYTAVELMKEYPQFIFTRSDVWFHQMIENLNPALFAQIRSYVEEGRWQIVGGWYIQPDCNLPTEYSFRKHIEIGWRYFQKKFGRNVTIGYNVDSFGHAGSLPRILSEAGYDAYVYMRPAPHEKIYPNRSQVFWWEAADSEHRILAYRIPVAYACLSDQIGSFIQRVINESDGALGHIMCFYGVGDHGGGPTRRQIEFILNNKDRFPGYELVLSHPRAYFDAIAGKTVHLPVIKGELQHHSVGCYSVLHRIKQGIRRAEHKLVQVQAVVNRFPEFTDKRTPVRLAQAWQDVLFNQFHDTYGGTCLKSAYPDLFDQIARARAQADQEQTSILRHYSAKLPQLELGDKKYLAYFSVLNPDSRNYAGWVEHELFGFDNPKAIKLVKVHNGRSGPEVPYQRLRSECYFPGPIRVLSPITLPGGGLNILGVKAGKPAAVPTDLTIHHKQITSRHWQVEAKSTGLILMSPTHNALQLTWQVFEDHSDTWSHGKSRLGDRYAGDFMRENLFLEETGPLRACLTWEGVFLHSRIRVRARVYRTEKWIELIISLRWNQPKMVLKMVLKPKESIQEHKDGIPGGVQVRDLDGKEYPFHDWTILSGKQSRIAVICPDIYGFDAQKEEVRLTLVRSPAYAFHVTEKPEKIRPTYDFTDLGEHEYRVLIAADAPLTCEDIQRIAVQYQQPPILWDPPYRRGYPQI